MSTRPQIVNQDGIVLEVMSSNTQLNTKEGKDEKDQKDEKGANPLAGDVVFEGTEVRARSIVHNFLWDSMHGNQFVTSWVIPDVALFGVRATLATFLLLMWIINWILGFNNTNQPYVGYLYFFTYLTYTSALAMMLAMTVHSGSYVFSRSLPGSEAPTFARLPIFFKYLTFVVSNIQVPIQVIVVGVFWGLLNPKEPKSTWEAGSRVTTHGMALTAVTIDMLLTRTSPGSLLHLIFVLGVALLYVCYAFVLNAVVPPVVDTTTGALKPFWPYPFMDTSNKSGWIYYLAVLIAFALLFFIAFYVQRLRDFLGRKYGRKHPAVTRGLSSLA